MGKMEEMISDEPSSSRPKQILTLGLLWLSTVPVHICLPQFHACYLSNIRHTSATRIPYHHFSCGTSFCSSITCFLFHFSTGMSHLLLLPFPWYSFLLFKYTLPCCHPVCYFSASPLHMLPAAFPSLLSNVAIFLRPRCHRRQGREVIVPLPSLPVSLYLQSPPCASTGGVGI